MSWGHGAVQRTLLAELRKQQQAIDTICCCCALFATATILQLGLLPLVDPKRTSGCLT
jgi:hypothetical protein